MKRTRSALLALIVATGAALAVPAWADRGGDHHHGYGGWHGGYRGDHGDRGGDHLGWGLGVLFGSALLWSALQPRSAYYAPPPVYAPPGYLGPSFVSQYYGTPTVELPPPPPAALAAPQGSQSEPLAPGGQWWYYCGKPRGYYPYVKQCQVGWEKLPPTPPGQ
ncbi:MAG TPA: hypothetical protein VMV91_04260 [Rhodocyclaceae bacterium]|nr:hypothetical protein [Rhodocyclaceae bacterium]